MPLSAEQQKFYDFLKGVMPRWFYEQTRNEEEIHAFIQVFDDVREQIEAIFQETFILDSVGGTPDWLNQHAIDRGTNRRENETDATLRARLRSFEDTVTAPAILSAVNAVLVAAGGAADAVMVQLRADRAFLGTYTPSGTATISAPVATVQTLTLVSGTIFNDDNEFWVGRQITIAGSADPANDGTFVIASVISPTQLTYVNAAGSADATACDWDVVERRRAYLGRGYRLSHSGRPARFIVILPFGTSAATELAVTEMIREKKAGGFKAVVEVRGVP